MPNSPAQDSDGPLVLSLLSEGTLLPESLQVISCTIRRELGSIPWATLRIQDGDMPSGSFETSDGDTLVPGKEITVQAAYGTRDPQTLFKGIVVRHGLSITDANATSLQIECRDKAVAMTLGRTTAHFVDQTDQATLQALVRAHGLSADVDETPFTHPLLVQQHCSDWDFLMARAEVNGLLVAVQDGTVGIKIPNFSVPPQLTVTWGLDLIRFHADLDARTQLTSVEAVGWDQGAQSLRSSTPAKPLGQNAQGNLLGADLAKVASPPTLIYRTQTPQEQPPLDTWAKAVQVKAELGRICGRMAFQGNAKVQLAHLIELVNVGSRFSGPVFISAIQHELKEGNWLTEVEFGLKPTWHLNRPEVMAPPTGGLLPAVSGLQIGIVLKLDEDPAGEYRVQVKIPVSQVSSNEGVWARLLQPHASSGFGTFLLPEIDDEVVLGYFNEDPCHPVILGSLYSSAHQPPYPLGADNNIKAIRTRYGHEIILDEDKKSITLLTPNKNTVVINDGEASILLQDEHKNLVKLSADGICLESPKDITLKAKRKITLDAVSNVEITSKADVQVGGLNVNCEGKVAFSGKGSATAELSASGQTTVKGALVMIN